MYIYTQSFISRTFAALGNLIAHLYMCCLWVMCKIGTISKIKSVWKVRGLFIFCFFLLIFSCK